MKKLLFVLALILGGFGFYFIPYPILMTILTVVLWIIGIFFAFVIICVILISLLSAKVYNYEDIESETWLNTGSKESPKWEPLNTPNTVGGAIDYDTRS